MSQILNFPPMSHSSPSSSSLKSHFPPTITYSIVPFKPRNLLPTLTTLSIAYPLGFAKPILTMSSDNMTSNNSRASSRNNERWSLLGMTALVTGGTRGIGLAIVEELVNLGARVHTCARNESELQKCLGELDGSGFGISGSVCDVSVRSQREELMDTVSSVFDGKLNILLRSTMLGQTFENQW
ncbi:putative tropinone reductase [Tripterygium wilfordii]|uniref:Putative tropinone reductase n=1 Tax=Tripterygium wilfordii TaxID=458696 RepID=A0A7J7DE31_TRIWF|nr:tropinone reductase homolog At2g29260, chloroplastic-like isoform X2 [Tripterygium wilfordii]KAF5744571.1 putative tropinone reductase [Tripterygium wilfordii]